MAKPFYEVDGNLVVENLPRHPCQVATRASYRLGRADLFPLRNTIARRSTLPAVGQRAHTPSGTTAELRRGLVDDAASPRQDAERGPQG